LFNTLFQEVAMTQIYALLKRSVFLSWLFRASLGLTLLWVLNNAFDWLLYSAVMCYMGTITGGAVMTLLSVPFNRALIWGYEALGKDLLGFEALREMRKDLDPEEGNWFKRTLRKLVAKGRVGTFIFLSLYDPIPAMLFIKEGRGAFTKTDWKWFAVATTISNLSWAIFIAVGVVAVDTITGVCT